MKTNIKILLTRGLGETRYAIEKVLNFIRCFLVYDKIYSRNIVTRFIVPIIVYDCLDYNHLRGTFQWFLVG